MLFRSTDLRNYERAGRGFEFTWVDCSELFSQVEESLKRHLEERKVVLRCGPLPAIVADKKGLARVFSELIQNSVKFRSDHEPHINISSEKQEAGWRFSIRDNGIGIDPAFSKTIFLPAIRLNSPQKYPGRGIGLPVCKRIVEGHGGEMWVDSRTGEGATFHFTIPIIARDDHEPLNR